MNRLVKRYQELLVAEESLDSVDRALALVEEGLGVRVVVGETERALEAVDRQRREHEDSWRRLDEAIQEFDREEFEKAMARRLRSKERVWQRHRALRVAVTLAAFPEYLDRQADRASGAQYSFVMDSLIVLFHHAYFALLPTLDAAEWAVERGTLLHSMRRFADHVPGEGDRFRILALWSEALGQPQEAARYYAALVHATRSDAHEFMTVLQSCWTHLLEHEECDGALKLLLETYPRVPRAHLEEASKLILQTFEHQRGLLTHAGR